MASFEGRGTPDGSARDQIRLRFSGEAAGERLLEILFKADALLRR